MQTTQKILSATVLNAIVCNTIHDYPFVTLWSYEEVIPTSNPQ